MNGSRDASPVRRTRARPTGRRTELALLLCCSTTTFSPPANKEIIAVRDVPPLDADFIKALKKPDKPGGQIVHLNDDKEWAASFTRSRRRRSRRPPAA